MHDIQIVADVLYKLLNLHCGTVGTMSRWNLRESSAVFNKHVPGTSPTWSVKLQREVKVTDADAKQTAGRKKTDTLSNKRKRMTFIGTQLTCIVLDKFDAYVTTCEAFLSM